MKFVPKWKHFSGENKYNNTTHAEFINLERRPDRCHTFLANCPLANVVRLNAYECKCPYNSLTAGEYGCAQSHMHLWKHCVQISAPVVVFEDDAQFRENFNDIFKCLESNEFFHIDSILFLGGAPRGFDTYKKKYFNSLIMKKVPRNHWLRCECYIIFPKFAAQLLADYRFHKPIDTFINEYSNIYMLHSEIAYPGNSDIDSDTTLQGPQSTPVQ